MNKRSIKEIMNASVRIYAHQNHMSLRDLLEATYDSTIMEDVISGKINDLDIFDKINEKLDGKLNLFISVCMENPTYCSNALNKIDTNESVRDFGSKLRRLRIEQNLTQKELGEIIDLSAPSISKIENSNISVKERMDTPRYKKLNDYVNNYYYNKKETNKNV